MSLVKKLCLIGIVNRFRSIENPIIGMGEEYRNLDEYAEHGPQGWMPYMDTIIMPEEIMEKDLEFFT